MSQHSQGHPNGGPPTRPNRPSVVIVSQPSGSATNALSPVSYSNQATLTQKGNSYYDPKEWLWDILAWLFGTALLTTIITLMVVFNGKQLSEWHSKVQISTIVAVLSQLAQSAFLVPTEACIAQLKWTWFLKRRSTLDLERFDEASRGPWGSLMLLARLSRTPRLVHVGALSVILMMIFPPFFQEAIDIRLKFLEVSVSQPTAPQAVVYNTPDQTNAWNRDYLYRSDNGNAGADLYFAGIISSSMLSTSKVQTPSDVPATCSTGQCTWPPYTTLALCTSFYNITSSLEYQSSNTSSNGKAVTLPNIKLTDDYLTMWTTTVFGSGARATGHTGQRANTTLLPLNNTQTSILDLAHIYLAYYDPCLSSKMDGFRQKETWQAYKTSIGLCLQTMSTSYNASTNTSVIASHKDVNWTLSSNEIWWNATHPSAPDNAFAVKPYVTEFIAGQIGLSFNVSGSYIPGGDNYLYGSIFGATITNDIYGSDMFKCSNSTEHGLNGFRKRIDNLVNSINNGFRTAGTSTYVSGTAYQTVQQIHVDFRLLAPPCTLYLVLTVFFVATIVRTTNVPLWKMSQLAVLYALSRPDLLSTKRKMDKGAKGSRLSLSPNRWQLKLE